MIAPGKWIDEMVGSIEKYVNLETLDGTYRDGKVTGFTFREFEFNGEKVGIPQEIELNGDPTDRIPIDRIRSLVIV